MTGSEEDAQILAEKADRLIDAMEAIAQESGLKIKAVEKRQRRERKLVRVLGVIQGVIVLLSVAVVLIGVQVSNTSNDVGDVQERTNSGVLCPLFQQFVNADTPKAREMARKSGQDLKARDEAFRVIHKSYGILNCEAHQAE